MTVYIVVGGYDFEGTDMIGVYSTLALAEKAVKLTREDKSGYDNVFIETWDVEGDDYEIR